MIVESLTLADLANAQALVAGAHQKLENLEPGFMPQGGQGGGHLQSVHITRIIVL